MIVATFYKYVQMPNPKTFCKKHQKYCDKLGIRGKILVGEEGINGAISGTKKQIQKYKKDFNAVEKFGDIKFKDTPSEDHPYKKMVVRVRPEIVTLAADVDLKNTAPKVNAKTLKKWIDKENIVLIDGRNNYESRIGKFKGALAPDVSAFREFPAYVKKLQKYKKRKVVMYCTGGIRCEKASALLKQEGFENVYQLENGILEYISQFSDDNFEGRCFVFDSRISVPSGQKNEAITTCDLCHVPNDQYINCKNVKCDKFFICCGSCNEELNGTCSKKCRNIAKELNS